MNLFKLLPIIFSAMLLGAHFYRAGMIPLVVLSLLFPVLLFLRRVWAARLVQVILVLGAVEWLRTLLTLVAERRAIGQLWGRLVLILGLVAVFTGCSALLFYSRSLRKRYGLDNTMEEKNTGFQ